MFHLKKIDAGRAISKTGCHRCAWKILNMEPERAESPFKADIKLHLLRTLYPESRCK